MIQRYKSVYGDGYLAKRKTGSWMKYDDAQADKLAALSKVREKVEEYEDAESIILVIIDEAIKEARA